jgi:hypothetical protein
MPVRPRTLASAAALACNARPTPEIFALPVVVDVQVVEACKEAVGAQVVAACTEAVDVQVVAACTEVVDVQVAVVEGDADDCEAQPFSDKIGKKSHAR